MAEQTISKNNEQPKEQENWPIFFGSFSEKKKTRLSTSGGACTALGEIVIRNGGIVYGCRYSDDYRKVEYGVASSIESLDAFRGSKYTAPKLVIENRGKTISVFEDVANHLLGGKRILFIGLGCHVAALLANLSLKRIPTEKLITVDLICQGPTVNKVHEDYIDFLEKKYHSRIISFACRYKKRGWKPPYLRAEFSNGKVFEKPFYKTEYGFAMAYYSQKQCYDCRFKGENHRSDITVGDAWGISNRLGSFNPWGVSILLAHTEKGLSLIRSFPNTDFVVSQGTNEGLSEHNPMYFLPRRKMETESLFNELLMQKGLNYAVKICRRKEKGLWARLLRKVHKAKATK